LAPKAHRNWRVHLPYLDLTKGTLPLPGCLSKMDDSNLEHKLARSFDVALSQFIASEGSGADTAENRGRLAARLVVLSKLGETDEHKLASNAALYLRAFAGAMRIASGSKRAQAKVAPTSRIALGPDAIGAMAEALDRCLDGLPQGGVSSTVRDVLQKAILEAAGHGERNADRLQAFALEKLRTRS
jgi:hypothetical protein